MLGDNILKLRKKHGFSQEELSEKVGVTRQTISNWELNETQPNPEQLKLLSKALNVSVDELINNEIKSSIENKVSKLEKYTKLIIRLIIFLIIILAISFTANFIYQRTHHNNDTKKVELNCSLNDENFLVDMRSDNYYKCINCTKEIEELIENKYFESRDLDNSVKNIEFYVKEHNGSCKVKRSTIK